MGDAGIEAARIGRHRQIAHGQAFDMRFIDHTFRQRAGRPLGQGGHGALIDHHRLRHGEGAVAGVIGQIAPVGADPVAHQRIRPSQPAVPRPGIGVDQQFMRVKTVALLGRIRPVNPVAVALPGFHAIDPQVPDVTLAFGDQQAGHLAAAIVGEQAEFDEMGVGGKDGEVDATFVHRGPHRPWPSAGGGQTRQDTRQIVARRGHTSRLS